MKQGPTERKAHLTAGVLNVFAIQFRMMTYELLTATPIRDTQFARYFGNAIDQAARNSWIFTFDFNWLQTYNVHFSSMFCINLWWADAHTHGLFCHRMHLARQMNGKVISPKPYFHDKEFLHIFFQPMNPPHTIATVDPQVSTEQWNGALKWCKQLAKTMGRGTSTKSNLQIDSLAAGTIEVCWERSHTILGK